jgi:sulfonate transport system permease protein
MPSSHGASPKFGATAPIVYAAAGLAVFVAFWEGIADSGLVPQSLLPAPRELPAAFLGEFGSGAWSRYVSLSLEHYVLGYVCGAASGFALGVLTGMNRRLDWSLAWIVRLLRPIPNLAWAPFAIVWFGVGQSNAVFLISIGVFWIVFFAAQSSIRAVDAELVEVAAAFGFTTGREQFVKVLLPGAAPGVMVGLRTALGQAWMAVVAAELGGVEGLGSRMVQASGLLSMDVVVVYMLTMAALYGCMDAGFVLLQNRLTEWRA